MTTAPVKPKFIYQYTCKKPFRGGICGRQYTRGSAPITEPQQTRCGKCGEIIVVPDDCELVIL